MSPFMSKVLHVRFLKWQVYVNSPIADKLTGPLLRNKDRI